MSFENDVPTEDSVTKFWSKYLNMRYIFSGTQSFAAILDFAILVFRRVAVKVPAAFSSEMNLRSGGLILFSINISYPGNRGSIVF